MSQGFQKPGFGMWPPGMPTFQKTDSTLTLYLDPVGGDDDKVGTSRVNAVRTPARIADLIPLYCGNVDVHMRSGAAVLPDRGWFLASRLFNGVIRFIADESWDPAVFTVVGGDRTSGAATTDVVVKATGLVVNALQDASLRFTTGPAAAQYRRVRNNTATDIIPTRAFDPAPDVGDTYQIFTSNARFVLPDSDVNYANYAFCGDGQAQTPSDFDYPFWSGYDAVFARPTGLLFDGVNLEGSAGFGAYYFGRVPVFFFGTDALDNFQVIEAAVGGYGTTFVSGLSVGTEYALKDGWGFSSAATPYVDKAGSLAGNFSVGKFYQVEGYSHLYGGRYGTVFSYGGQAIFELDAGYLIPPLMDSSFAGFTVLVTTPAYVLLNSASITGGNVTARGARLDITSDVTGVGPVNIFSEGVLICDGGTPKLGGGGNDWTVFGIAAFNKSFFGASNTIKFGTDGSLAKRVF